MNIDQGFLKFKALATVIGALVLVGHMDSARADAGPPMVTDDPGTPGDGRFEINVATLLNRSSDSKLIQLPLLDVNYGVGDRLQLKVETPWLIAKDSTGATSGQGNVLLGVKWRFYDGGENSLKVSTYPQVELKPMNSQSVAKGLADPGVNVLLPIEMQKNLGAFDVTADFGRWQRNSLLESSWMGGVVFGRTIHDDDQVMLEIHTERTDHTQQSQTLVNVGTHLEVNPTLTLLLSAGRDIKNSITPPSSFFCYFGLQIHLGNREK
jgi:hypothetical protein